MNEKLTAIVNKALEKGWKPYDGIDSNHVEAQARNNRVVMYYYNDSDLEVALAEWSVYGIIFDHGFAKALWGDTHNSQGWTYQNQSVEAGNVVVPGRDIQIAGPDYWYHLARMVLAPDPLEYLIENVKREL